MLTFTPDFAPKLSEYKSMYQLFDAMNKESVISLEYKILFFDAIIKEPDISLEYKILFLLCYQ